MEEILSGLDLPEEVTKTLTQRIEKSIKDAREASQNDPELHAKVKREAEGKVFNSVERWIKKQSGISLEDLDKELSGGERVKQALTLGFKSIEGAKDQTNQELQDQLLASKELIRKLKEEEIPGIEKKFQERYSKKQIETKLIEKLSGIDTVVTKDAATNYLNAVLSKNYQLGWQDDEISVLTKDNLKPVINDKPFGVDDLIKHHLKEAGMLKQSNGTPPAGTPPGTPPRKPQEGMSEASRKLAAELQLPV